MAAQSAVESADRSGPLAGFKAANAKGIVLAFGRFDMHMYPTVPLQVESAVAAALRKQQSHVTILMDSIGGYIKIANMFISAMHLSRPSPEFRYVGYVLTRAMSACFTLLQHCDWRVAHPASLLLAHYGEQIVDEQIQSVYQSGAAVALDRQLRLVRQDIAEFSGRSGTPPARIHHLHRADRVLLAQQALELGLLDEIIDPLPTRSQRPDYRIGIHH